MIRQDPTIKGMLVKDISVLLSQFADDTTLYLDGKEESFTKCVNVLARCASLLGFKTNEQKTSANCISCKKKKKRKKKGGGGENTHHQQQRQQQRQQQQKKSTIRFLPHLIFSQQSRYLKNPWCSLLYKYRNYPIP